MGRFHPSTGKSSTHGLGSIDQVVLPNGALIRSGLVFLALCFGLGMILGGAFAGETIVAPGGSDAQCERPIRARSHVEERAERASDPISRQHYREMAAHYRSLSVEHQELTSQPEHESAH